MDIYIIQKGSPEKSKILKRKEDCASLQGTSPHHMDRIYNILKNKNLSPEYQKELDDFIRTWKDVIQKRKDVLGTSITNREKASWWPIYSSQNPVAASIKENWTEIKLLAKSLIQPNGIYEMYIKNAKLWDVAVNQTGSIEVYLFQSFSLFEISERHFIRLTTPLQRAVTEITGFNVSIKIINTKDYLELSTFYVTDDNKDAFNTIEQLINNYDKADNPQMIYIQGSSGAGKTHLLSGIFQRLKNDDICLGFTSFETLYDAFILDGLNKNDTNLIRCKNMCKYFDILLVDNITHNNQIPTNSPSYEKLLYLLQTVYEDYGITLILAGSLLEDNINVALKEWLSNGTQINIHPVEIELFGEKISPFKVFPILERLGYLD